jgi:hypothetical protein
LIETIYVLGFPEDDRCNHRKFYISKMRNSEPEKSQSRERGLAGSIRACRTPSGDKRQPAAFDSNQELNKFID